MRNRFPGTCYRCNTHVPAGEGHFERHGGGWRTQHASCAIQHRRQRYPSPPASEPTGSAQTKEQDDG